MEQKKPYKIAIIAPVPFYYHAPLYRKLEESSEIDLMVYYCSGETLYGADVEKSYKTKGNFTDKEYLLSNYKYKFLKNYSSLDSYLSWPFGLVNFGIWKEIKQNNYDAVVLQSWTNLTWWLAFLACLKFKIPFLFMTDSNISSEPLKSKSKRFFKKIILGNLLFKKASGFLTSGKANEEFYRYYGVPERKMIRLYFSWGYDELLIEAHQFKLKRNEIRNSLNIKKNDFVILYVGRLSPEKSPVCLLDAFSKVNIKDKKLFFVGDGALRTEIEQKINNLKTKEVFIAGFQPRKIVSKFYTAADVFVLPSVAETWGMVVNEAMCFSLPIIVSNSVGSGVDLVKNVYNGFIFKSGDVNGLSSSIEHLAGLTREKRELFGSRSKEMITKWIYDINPARQMVKMLEIIKNKKYRAKFLK